MEAWDTESLGLGSLDAVSIQHILRVARCLIRSKPEEEALDLPAQRLLASMQASNKIACIKQMLSISQQQMLWCVKYYLLPWHRGTCLGHLGSVDASMKAQSAMIASGQFGEPR